MHAKEEDPVPKPTANASDAGTVPPAQQQTRSIAWTTYDEPSDIYPGVMLPRKRPSEVKIKYQTYEAGKFVNRFMRLYSFEAACALHAIEVLNGTHHKLYDVAAAPMPTAPK